MVCSISVNNLVIMDDHAMAQEPELSWVDLPWSQDTVERLKALFVTSSMNERCTFEDYIEDIRMLKAPRRLFGVASEKFREGEQIALRMQQFLENKQKDQPVDLPQQVPQLPLPNQIEHELRDQHSLQLPNSQARDRGPFKVVAASDDIPPIPPDAPGIHRRNKNMIDYNFEDFWEFSVQACKNSKKAISTKKLIELFCVAGEGRARDTVSKWFTGNRMRFSPEQVYAAAGIGGSWPVPQHG